MDFLGLLPVALGIRVADDGASGGPEFADPGQHRHHLGWVRRESVAGEHNPTHAFWKIGPKGDRNYGSGRVPYDHGAFDFQGIENF